MTAVWRQVGDLIVRGQSQILGTLDRLEGDVSVLKTDVAVLKTDVADLTTGMAETNARLDRMELANERRFDRVDARLEQLVALIMRDETGGS